MIQLNMAEMQAAAPAILGKSSKPDLAVAKTKAVSGSNSFSKHLQRLIRSSSESKDPPAGNREMSTDQRESSAKPVAVEFRDAEPPSAQAVPQSQKPEEPKLHQDLAADQDKAEVLEDKESKPEKPAQEAPVNEVLNQIPVAAAPETILELPAEGAAAPAVEPLAVNGASPGSVLTDIPVKPGMDTAPTDPVQANPLTPAESPELLANSVKPNILPEVEPLKSVSEREFEGDANFRIQDTTLVESQTDSREMSPSELPKDNQAKQVVLSLTPDLQGLPEQEIPVSAQAVAVNPETQTRPKAEQVSHNQQPVPETAAASQYPADDMAAIVSQVVAAASPPTVKADGSQGSKQAATVDPVKDDPGALLTQTNSDKAVIASTTGEQALQAGDSGQSGQSGKAGESKEGESKPDQNLLKFRTIAGLEAKVVKPQPKPVGTDVKKLIDFESKKLKTDSGETVKSEGDAGVKAEKADSDATLLLLSKNGPESDKTLLRNPVLQADNDFTVEPEKLLEQIVKKAEMMVKQNSSEMKIQLQPEFLGKMTIKIVLEEGIMTAKFITDSHQVKHMLDSNLNTLKQSLEAQGIRVEKAEVNVQLNNGGMFDGSEQNPQESWQRYQFMSSQQGHGFNPQGYPAGGETLYNDDEMAVNVVPETEYGISGDGTMNFLV